MEFVRSIPAEPLDPNDPTEQRQQLNVITSFIDASNVYGSSAEEEEELREANGLGFLLKFERSRQGALLPSTEREICITRPRGSSSAQAGESPCFLAGDERCNEQPQLATIHTIFLRLHNKIAQKMAAAIEPGSVENFNETVFQSTRRVVGAIVQNIMYGEWLPIALGQSTVDELGLSVEERSQYDPQIDPSILTEFSTAAYRFGHSLIPRRLPAVSSRGSRTSLRLRYQFLRPEVVRSRFNDLALGLVLANRSQDQAQAVDSSVSREVTRHLFEPRRRRGFDLVSFNIQRGRDHGIPPYNDLRQSCGLRRITSFDDPVLGNNGDRLRELYACIVGEQMYRLKFGDRFFFTHDEDDIRFTDVQLSELHKVTAAVVMCVAVPSIDSVQQDAFLEVDPSSNPLVSCEQVRKEFLNPADFVVEAEAER
ncbi:hypothetical protein BaRGS_00018196 [Batillaria attramentaria]|uniref:Peroxidase n=1 Tax=Batillaria attramentaria TaxID=370345 RepID=A0ABD0KUH4_9CAEN